MADATAVNKVIYGGKTLIDLTADTVEASKMLSGFKAHDKSGAIVTGTCTYDSNTSDATVAAAEMLFGKTAYKGGAKITGTMSVRGAVTGVINTKAGLWTIPPGYHDGSGKVQIDNTEQGKLIPANIRSGISVLGVTGTMSGTEDVKAQSKTVTPATTSSTVTPDAGYNYLSQVTVGAIPYSEISNTAGGLTVTIA